MFTKKLYFGTDTIMPLRSNMGLRGYAAFSCYRLGAITYKIMMIEVIYI